MINKLKSLFNLDEDELVKYDDLGKVTPGVWINLLNDQHVVEDAELYPSTWYKRYNTKVSGQEIFITRIYTGHGYHYHSHDCKETITCINGSVIVNDKKVVRQNENETFYTKTRHKVFFHDSLNGEYVDLLVEFLKTNHHK